ncbi:hypothetical protein Sjap_008335 [Stephania japonica]|uniref:C2H2-type domain-containing protein n=1 Tax=Stephania japonica TaxID=461633 RepID=A0AAP0PED0_9MAGN
MGFSIFAWEFINLLDSFILYTSLLTNPLRFSCLTHLIAKNTSDCSSSESTAHMDRRMNSLKDNGEEGSSVRYTVRESPWNCCASNRYCGVALLNGFSWPPCRSYSCSFCKREFRSAQALGGHMNVHRRDRARLRVQSPLLLQNDTSDSNPNSNQCSKTSSDLKSIKCNPNFSPDVPSPLMMGASYYACLSSSTNHSSMWMERNSTIIASASNSDDWGSTMKALKELKEEKEKKVRVDLGLNSVEDLDLELRLGYS